MERSRYHVVPRASGRAELAYHHGASARYWPVVAVAAHPLPGQGFLRLGQVPLPVLPTAPPQSHSYPPDLPTC